MSPPSSTRMEARPAAPPATASLAMSPCGCTTSSHSLSAFWHMLLTHTDGGWACSSTPCHCLVGDVPLQMYHIGLLGAFGMLKHLGMYGHCPLRPEHGWMPRPAKNPATASLTMSPCNSTLHALPPPAHQQHRQQNALPRNLLAAKAVAQQEYSALGRNSSIAASTALSHHCKFAGIEHLGLDAGVAHTLAIGHTDGFHAASLCHST
eukprot:1139525-Pelagomonas_calceolata.AAC.2